MHEQFRDRRFPHVLLYPDQGTEHKIENPCAYFKPLKNPKAKAWRRPPVYRQDMVDAILAHATPLLRAAFATLLLAGLREEELCFLTCADADVKNVAEATIRVTSEGKEGFTPKDYEERLIPIQWELAERLKALPRTAKSISPRQSASGRRTSCAA